MTLLKQTFAALRVALAGIGSRTWASLNTVLGTGVVVMVMVAILSIGAGYRDAMRLSAVGDGLLILRGGTQSEMESSLTGAEASLIMAQRQRDVSSDGAGPAAALETYVVTSLADKRGEAINVALRGVTPDSAAMRPGFRVVEGRDIVEGRRELVVGRRAQDHFGGMDVGQSLRIFGAEWTVVGVFEQGGSIAESEMWGDLGIVQAAAGRGDSVQVVQTRRGEGETASLIEGALNADGRLNVSVVSRADYYGGQARQMQRFVSILGLVIVGLMAAGAIFAALNTGASHVKTRAKELATLSVLGWTNGALGLAVVIEAVILNLLGAVLGLLASMSLLSGRTVSTLFFAKDFTQVVFSFALTPAIMLQAIGLALVIGLAGSLGPALQLRRLPVARILVQRA